MTACRSAEYLDTWQSFIDELEAEILPIYQRHEQSFDPWGVHGRPHICRSVLFSEYMARFYTHSAAVEVDFYAIRVATALHDSGRQANGVDFWEKDSRQNCRQYVKSSAAGEEPEEYAEYVAGLLSKRRAGGIAQRIVYDADVLEIMRPCCGHGGIEGFRRDALHFLGSDDPQALQIADAGDRREAFIREAWQWICATEQVKLKFFRSPNYMRRLLEKLENEKTNYPLLASLL